MPQRDLLFSESTNKLILGSSGTFTLITIMSVIHYYPDYCLLAVFFYAHGWSTTTGSGIIVNSKALMCPLLFPHLWPFSFSNKYWEKLCDNRDKKKKKKTHSLPKHTDTDTHLPVHLHALRQLLKTLKIITVRVSGIQVEPSSGHEINGLLKQTPGPLVAT